MKPTRFRRRRLRTNVLANAAGRLVPGLLTILAVPVIVAVLGAEAYGLIGFFAVLQMMFGVLDQGLTTTATREIAANRARETGAGSNRTLIRSLEAVYWPVAILIGLGISIASDWLATTWLNPGELAVSDVRAALVAGGIAIAARWPASLYRGVLDGLELQVAQNALAISAAAVRVLGGLGVVLWIESSVAAFMTWQALVACVEVAVYCAAAWSVVGGGGLRARVDASLLRRIWRYAAALNLVGALGFVIANVDRVVISNLLPLEELGYYTIALTAAALIPHLAAAVSIAILPRFAGAAAVGDAATTRHTYYQAVHVVSFVAVGVALTFAFFPSSLLSVWVRAERVVDEASVLLVLLALGFLLNALYSVAYTLAVASGHARVPLYANLAGAPLLVAVMIPAVQRWGAVGAASAWLGLTALLFVWYVLSVHRRVLGERVASAFVSSVLRYVAVGALALGAGRLVAGLVGPAAAYAALVAAVLSYALAAGALLPADVSPLRSRRAGSLR